MAYTFTSVDVTNATVSGTSSTAIKMVLPSMPETGAFDKKTRPYIKYIKGDIISNVSYGTTSLITSGTYPTLYCYVSKPNNMYLADKFVNNPGLYLIYNPTDNSNNFGFYIAKDGTKTAADFETLKKYAPWPIVAPAV